MRDYELIKNWFKATLFIGLFRKVIFLRSLVKMSKAKTGGLLYVIVFTDAHTNQQVRTGFHTFDSRFYC